MYRSRTRAAWRLALAAVALLAGESALAPSPAPPSQLSEAARQALVGARREQALVRAERTAEMLHTLEQAPAPIEDGRLRPAPMDEGARSEGVR